MQNGHSDPERLLERIRNEVRQRKLAIAPPAPQLEIPQAAGSTVSLPQVTTAWAPSASFEMSIPEKPHLKLARGALERAAMKNERVRRWPRFLRGLRRNQGAINESFIRAVGPVLETIEWLQQKFALLDSRMREVTGQLETRAQQAGIQGQQIAEMERRIAAERNRLIEEQQKQFLEVSYKLINYQTEVSARFERVMSQQFLTERQLMTFQNFVRDQDKQKGNEQRQIAELQDFLNAQQRQNIENAKLLGEQQEQLTEVRALLDQSSRRLDETVQRTSKSEEMAKDIQAFVTAQQDQTAEEQRQLSQQQKQLEEVGGQLIEYHDDACARYHLTIEALEQEKRRIAEIRSRLEALQPGAFSGAGVSHEIEQLRDRINAMQASFAIIQEHLVRPESVETIQAIAPEVSQDLKEHETDAFYLAFENQFRGDRDLIKERLRFYLPIIERVKATTGNASAVDLGCGRGEWLELLREQGYEGAGVDSNLCMVEECRSRGLRAEYADAISYLRNLPSNSLSLVTGYHIVEHLLFNQLFHFFRESFRVLCPGGIAIFETPNPECSHVPDYSFYLDPTHRNPIPQELLCFAARQAGFEGARVERLQAYVEDGVFKGYLDYAGIFTK